MSAAASRDAQPTRLPRRAAHNTQKDHAQPEDLRRPGPRTKAELLQMIKLLHHQQFRCSIVVSISACHAEDPGSIPGGGVLQLVQVLLTLWCCNTEPFRPGRKYICHGDACLSASLT